MVGCSRWMLVRTSVLIPSVQWLPTSRYLLRLERHCWARRMAVALPHRWSVSVPPRSPERAVADTLV